MCDTRRIVMTTGTGYRAEQCFHFLCSLRNSGYTGDIAFFTDNAPADLQELFKRFQVTAVPIQQPLLKRRHSSLYPTLARPMRAKHFPGSKFVELYKNWLPIPSTRFIAYRQYLQNLSSWYDECFVCDVRDIIFQTNPFDTTDQSPIAFYEEHAAHKLCNCQYNRPWIEEAYGKKAVATWGQNTAICSGATHLRGEGIFTYLDLMVEHIKQTNTTTPGVDQAIHNYIGYNLDVPGLRIIPQTQAQVLNIGTTPFDQLAFNSDGLLLNAQGQLAAVVHQYDRHGEHFNSLLAQLCQSPSVA